MIASPASRDSWLDGLRALAALMVFVHHASPETYLGGWDAGVLVFFTLSGYLLYRPFLRGPVDLRGYAIRRLLRIYPAYLVASVGLAAVNGYSFDPVGVLTMDRPTVIVAWTLQIEVVFYAALPLIAFLAGRRREVLLAVAVVSLGAGAVALATTRIFPGGFVAWVWAFVPGMAVAYVADRWPEIAARAHARVVPAAGVALVLVSVVPDIHWPDLPAAVGSALVLAWLLTLREPRPGIARVMVAGGALSYSFYLWHEGLMAWDRPPSVAGAVAVLLLTAAVSAVVYLAVERPAIELGRRLSGRHVTQPQAPEPRPLPVTAP